MIRLKYSAGLGTAGLLAALAAMPAGAQGPADHVPGRILVQFKATATAEQVRSSIAAANAQFVGDIPRSGVSVLKIPSTANLDAVIAALQRRADVQFAEMDRVRKPDATPNDPGFASEWHLSKIGAPTAWNTSAGSSSIIVAILDTGCDPTHPDLAPNYVPGWNFFDGNNNTADVYGHGTATAGTAAAAVNNGVGVSGVAGGCKIMPCRISGTDGYATYSAAASALTWAADHGARVANISYQMSESSSVQSAAQYFQNKGGVVTISAGNNSTNVTNADNPYVLTVSSTGSSDVKSSWSNYGNNVDVAAPGESIYTTCKGGGYGWWSGTSFSAPIVAGTAALVLSANPSLTGAQAQDIIKKSALDLGTAGWDNYYGWGRVDSANAIAKAIAVPAGDTVAPSVSFASPSAAASVAGTVSLAASASDNVGVTSVSFYVDNALVGTVAKSPFTLSWNSTASVNGTHTLKAVAWDAANNSSAASISVNVNNPSIVADTIAPSVNIVTPAASIVVTGNSLSVSVSASDNVGVVKVELYLDGALISADTSAPWTFSLNTKKWARGTHTLQSKAYDAAKNVGASQLVTITK